MAAQLKHGGTSQHGFTLIEILVATAILGIILMTVYGVLARALFAKNHSEERADLYAAGRETVLKLSDEIEGALPPTAGAGVGFIGVAGTAQVPTDSVQFVMVIRRQFGASQQRGGRALVTYSLDPIEGQQGLFALRREEQPLNEAPPAEETGEDAAAAAEPTAPVASAAHIVDQVAGLRFRYMDPMTGEWVDKWDTTADPPSGQPWIPLPGAVEITLFLADKEGGIHDFDTFVDLPLVRVPPTPVGR